MTKPEEKKKVSKEPEFYEPYVAYARTLRTWFIAFGIGGPGIFLAQPEAAKNLADSGAGACIILSFLGGVATQILIALIYKYAMSYMYLSECELASTECASFRIFDWIASSFWLEIVLDLLTIVFFTNATVRTLKIFL